MQAPTERRPIPPDAAQPRNSLSFLPLFSPAELPVSEPASTNIPQAASHHSHPSYPASDEAGIFRACFSVYSGK